MNSQLMRETLLRRELNELYQLRGDQYTSKDELVDDVIANDDGSLAELIESEGSFLFLLMGKERSQAMTRFVRLKDVCELFGVTRFTIRNWIERGEFPQPIRKGLFLRWPEDEILGLVERLKKNR